MIDQATFEYLLPLAYQWCKATEDFVLTHGVPLGPRQLADANRAGVRDCSKIRMLVVDRIPLPENPELAEAARHVRILTEETRCVGFGYAVITRADAWGDRELLVHNFVHIAQCERSGGLELWVRRYLSNRRSCAQFSLGPLEEEARGLAREICTAASTGPVPLTVS